MQSDGSLLLVGDLSDGTTHSIVWRLSADGTRDTAFSLAPQTLLPPATKSVGVGIILDAQSRLLIAWLATTDGTKYFSYFTRYNAQGQIDTTFNGGSPLSAPLDFPQDGSLVTFAVDAKKRIWQGAITSDELNVYRWTDIGTPDSTFGNIMGEPGFYLADSSPSGGALVQGGPLEDIVPFDDGTVALVGAGVSSSSYKNGFFVSKYDATFTLDTTWAEGGFYVRTGVIDVFQAVKTTDEALYIGAQAIHGSDLSDTSFDVETCSLGTDPQGPVAPGPPPIDVGASNSDSWASHVALGSVGGKSVVALAGPNGSNKIALARFDVATGTYDAGFGFEGFTIFSVASSGGGQPPGARGLFIDANGFTYVVTNDTTNPVVRFWP